MSAVAAIPAAAAAPLVELIALRAGPEEYVVDIMRVREVLRPVPIVPLRQGPAHIEGVISLRRSVVPVVDLGRRLGLGSTTAPTRRIIVAVVDGRTTGILVDAVVGVVRAPAAALRPGPPQLAAAAPYFLGLCAHGGRELIMLDVRRVVTAAAEGAA